MSALMFGSISSVADTSELQRDAFNQAFARHGLDWRWDRDEYRALLTGNGGRDRVAAYARSRGEDVDADAVHASKSQIFQETLATSTLQARPGVVEALSDARDAGWRTALVTTTSPENVTALLKALDGALTPDAFDLVVDSTKVETSKPDPAAYTHALTALGEDAGHAVAIEDNVGGVQAATAAGIATVAFPNVNTAGHDFGSAETVDRIDFATLRRHVKDA